MCLPQALAPEEAGRPSIWTHYRTWLQDGARAVGGLRGGGVTDKVKRNTKACLSKNSKRQFEWGCQGMLESAGSGNHSFLSAMHGRTY